MDAPKRRKEDDSVISYKTLAIGCVALIVSLVGYVHLSDIGGLHKKLDEYTVEGRVERREIKSELSEIRKDTSEIGVLKIEIKHLQKDKDRIEGDLAMVKKKQVVLDGKIDTIISRLVEEN